MIKLTFRKSKDTFNRYAISLKGVHHGSYKLYLSLDAISHDINKYFLYQTLKPDAKKYSFPNMNFSGHPPGERFGPWPGWRFVPELPKLSLEINNGSRIVKYFFLGDEEFNKELHAFATIGITNQDNIFLKIDSDEIFLKEVKLYESKNIELSNINIKILKEKFGHSPLLIFNQNELIEFRKKLNSKSWNKILSLLDNWNLKWNISEESRTLEGKERLNSLDKIVLSSFKAVITEEELSIAKAIRSFKSFIEESSDPDYIPMQIDTQIGECLFNMCVTYDWLNNFISDKERTLFRSYLKRTSHKLKKFLDPERDDFAQSHFLGCVLGLLAYSILFIEEEQSERDIIFISRTFATAINMLPSDGSYPHGINLWIYEYSFLTRITELLYRFTNQNHWKRKDFWINSSLFRQYATSLDKLHGITFGDPQYRVCGDAAIHYLIAARIKDKRLLKYADSISDIDVSGVDYRSVTPRRRVWEFIYSSKSARNNSLPLETFKHFKDTGQIFITNKKNKILFTAKAGPPLGNKRYSAGEWGGYGHSDPCNGSFLIYLNNSFLISGPESSYKRNTNFHNTININGYGQYGDKMVWAPDFNLKDHFPNITKIENKLGYYYIRMNLTNCYFDFLNAKLIQREFVFIEPCILFGIDSIHLNSKSYIEWNLHTNGKYSDCSEDGFIKISDNNNRIFLKIIGNISNVQKGFTPFIPAYPNSGKIDSYLRFTSFEKDCNYFYLFLLNKDPRSLDLKSTVLSSGLRLFELSYKNERWQIVFDSAIKSIKKK